MKHWRTDTNEIVTPAGSPHIHPTDLHALTRLSHALDTYDEQFSMPSMLTRLVVKLGESQEKSPRAHMEEEHDNEVETAVSLQRAHGGILQKTGLSLEPVTGKVAVIKHEDAQLGSAELRINVVNSTLFIRFLSGLTIPEVINVGADAALARFSSTLARQVSDNYDLYSPPPEAIELLGRLPGILGEYRRLGIRGWGVDKLDAYRVHAQEGDLREYIDIQQAGLLLEPGTGFGPAEWQNTATVAYLDQRWNEALAILADTKANPRATALYDTLHAHLAACVVIAKQRLHSLADVQSLEEMKTKANLLEYVHQHLA